MTFYRTTVLADVAAKVKVVGPFDNTTFDLSSYNASIKAYTTTSQGIAYMEWVDGYENTSYLEAQTISGYTFKGWYTYANNEYELGSDIVGSATKLIQAAAKLTVPTIKSKAYQTKFEKFYVCVAKYEQQYIVSYNGNTGTSSKSSDTVSAGHAVTLPSASKSGYKFTGWYTASSGGTYIGTSGDTYTPTSSITLYAQYTVDRVFINVDLVAPVSMSVKYLPSNQNQLQTLSLNTLRSPSGGYITANCASKNYAYEDINFFGDGVGGYLEAVAPTGYYLLGWFTNESDKSWPTVSDATKLISRNAKITQNEITSLACLNSFDSRYFAVPRVIKSSDVPRVKFDANGGSGAPAEILVFPDNGWTCPDTVPTRAGYTFKGWANVSTATSPDFVIGRTYGNITSSITIYAVWMPNQGTLVYNATGGTVTPLYKLVSVGDAYGTLPTPSRSGCTFLGWFTATSGGTQVNTTTKMSTSGVDIIYAHWDTGGSVSTTVIVTLNANGGTLSVSYVTASGNYPTLPIPTRPGYSFSGWFSTPYGNVQIHAGDPIIFDEDHEIFAKWNRGKSVITFDANGGTCNTATKEVGIGTAAGRLPIASMDGKNFDGWYTDRENGEKVSASTVITSSLTVYAHYSTFTTTPWVTITISD